MSTGREILQNAFADTAKGDGRAFVAMLADDVEWEIIGTTDWSQTFRGKTAVLRELLGPLAAQFEGGNRVEAVRFIGDGDLIAVEGRNHSVAKGGTPYPNRYCWVFEMRGDQVTRVIEYCDTALVERVLVRPGAA